MQSKPASRNAGVEANARLTGYVAIVLLVLLGLELLSGLAVRRLLVFHGLLGLFVIPPLLLKLASVGYRFVRYYTGEPRYRAAGTPALAMRVVAPVLVALTVVVFASGLELWLFGYRYGFFWIPVHHGSAYLWSVTLAIHAVNYLRRAPALVLADWRDQLPGVVARRSLLVASLVLGAALVVAMIPFHSPFAFLVGGS